MKAERRSFRNTFAHRHGQSSCDRRSWSLGLKERLVSSQREFIICYSFKSLIIVLMGPSAAFPVLVGPTIAVDGAGWADKWIREVL
jgi:hypothetical protein